MFSVFMWNGPYPVLDVPGTNPNFFSSMSMYNVGSIPCDSFLYPV